MSLLACLFLLAACLCPPPAAAGSFARAPLEDVGFPFWCDWGYEWDERCRDDTAHCRSAASPTRCGVARFGSHSTRSPAARA